MENLNIPWIFFFYVWTCFKFCGDQEEVSDLVETMISTPPPPPNDTWTFDLKGNGLNIICINDCVSGLWDIKRLKAFPTPETL